MTCTHWWFIEGQGAHGHGKCTRCGEERDFKPKEINVYSTPNIPHKQGYLGLSREYGNYGRYDRGWTN